MEQVAHFLRRRTRGGRQGQGKRGQEPTCGDEGTSGRVMGAGLAGRTSIVSAELADSMLRGLSGKGCSEEVAEGRETCLLASARQHDNQDLDPGCCFHLPKLHLHGNMAAANTRSEQVTVLASAQAARECETFSQDEDSHCPLMIHQHQL